MKTSNCFPALNLAKLKFSIVFASLFFFISAPIFACDLIQQNVPDCEDDNSATFTVDVSGINLTKVSIVSSSGFSYGSLTFNAGANTFTFGGVSFSNYKGFGAFTVKTSYSDHTSCNISGYVVECCNTDEYDYIFVEQTIPAATYSAKTIWLYGDVSVASGTSFYDDQILLATDAQITLQSSVTAEFEECRLTNLCEYAWDGIIVDNSNQTLNLISTQLDNSLRGIFTSNNAEITLDNASLYSNRISLYINDYTSNKIDMDGTDIDEIQSESAIVQHSSSGISMSSYFPTDCGSALATETAPIVVIGSENVHLGSASNSTNTFTNTSGWGNDNTYIHVDNSQVFIYNNTFNATQGAICAYDESKVNLGGTSSSQGNLVKAAMNFDNSSFYVENNDIEAGFTITDVDFTDPGTGTEDGGQIINNDFSNESLLQVDQNGVNSYLRVYSNDFTDYRISFTDFTDQSNGKLIFHSNELDNDGYTTYTAVEVDGCDGMTFADNTLKGPNPATPAGTKTNMGVDWIATEDVDEFSNNTIRYFNRGVNLSGDNSGTELYCNAFLNNYYQIFLENTTITQQGSGARRTGNCFSHIFTPPTNPYYDQNVSGTSSQPGSSSWYTYTAGGSTDCEYLSFTTGNPINSYVTIIAEVDEDCPSVVANKSRINQESLDETIFPNPTEGILIVKVKANNNLQIFNFQGSLIEEISVSKGTNSIDISHIPSGQYVMKIGEKKTIVVKQ